MGVPDCATWPSMSGFSWLAVEEMKSLPSSPTLSQAQPEPKRLAAAALNCAFISSTDPKSDSILPFKSPTGELLQLPGGASVVHLASTNQSRDQKDHTRRKGFCQLLTSGH